MPSSGLGSGTAWGALTAVPWTQPWGLVGDSGQTPHPLGPQLPQAYLPLTRVGPAEIGEEASIGGRGVGQIPDLWFPCQLLLDQQVALKRYEVAGRRVLFYFDEVLAAGSSGRGLLGTQCW